MKQDIENRFPPLVPFSRANFTKPRDILLFTVEEGMALVAERPWEEIIVWIESQLNGKFLFRATEYYRHTLKKGISPDFKMDCYILNTDALSMFLAWLYVATMNACWDARIQANRQAEILHNSDHE